MIRRIIAAVLAAAQVLATLAFVAWHTALAAAAAGPPPCGNPGHDGSPPNVSGIVNSYYYPPNNTTLSAGSTSITISTYTQDTSTGGSATAIGAGDMLLLVQMQDGKYNASNTSTFNAGSQTITSASYGDGSTGSGFTSLGNAGVYEYAVVTNYAGGVATIQGAGTGGGLVNSYIEKTTPSLGQDGRESFQIIRVPQYLTTTLAPNFRGAAWNGLDGGVVAVDIATTLNLGSGTNIFATADGFRAGGYTVATANASAGGSADFVLSISSLGVTGHTAPNGTKGEGVLGTPGYWFQWTNFTGLTPPGTPSGPAVPGSANTADGYYAGDLSRGAPGNAGGGGTDADPKLNDQNPGGGGGGNGGAGGNGGYPWNPQEPKWTVYPATSGTALTYSATNFHDLGGRGGSAIPGASINAAHVFMGGGGGAGSNNNNSDDNTALNTPVNSYGNYGSSGGPGGGVIMMRIANTDGTGTATLYADGVSGLAPANDGGGGGGAGGTIMVTTPVTSGSPLAGITAYADGGAGTTAASTYAQTASHGPGGGGGGGIVISSSALAAFHANGGANGVTSTTPWAYGAGSGSNGYATSTAAASQVPGVRSGAECYNPSGATFTGPVDSTDATYNGAAETGAYDGNSAHVSNTFDFTARGLVFPAGTQILNSSGTPGTPVGNTLSGLSSNPTANVDNELYYDASTSNGAHVITLSAVAPAAPAGWTARICADNGSDTAPNCSATGTTSCLSPGNSGWVTVGSAAAATATAQYCAPALTKTKVTYWVVYSAPTTGLVAFNRYDSAITATDDQQTTTSNITHDELYAGFIVLTKPTPVVVSNGCPPGATYSPSLPAGGICPGGKLQYTVDYRNIAVGAGATATWGTQGQNGHAFPLTGAGTFVISDDGTSGTNPWGPQSNGLTEILGAGLGAGNTSCGSVANKCGDSTAGTTFTNMSGGALTAGATGFKATIGGASFQLYPMNFPSQTGQGTITFAIQIK